MERFEYESKMKLYNLIAKHQRSNVIFLSGDVHYAIPTASFCQATTGGYRIPEFTSSGMTHTEADFVLFGKEILHFITHSTYTIHPPLVELNYGLIEIKKNKIKVMIK